MSDQGIPDEFEDGRFEVMALNLCGCGGSAMWNPKEEKTGTYADDLGFIDCTNCGVRTEGRTSRDVAEAAWNRAHPSVVDGGHLLDSLKLARGWLPCVEGHLRDGTNFKRDLAAIDVALTGVSA